MKKSFVTFLLGLSIFAHANNLQIGESLPHTTFKDQFDQEYTINKTTTTLLFAFSKDNGHIIKEFMQDKPTNYLVQKGIIFIADISAMPSIIASWFAIPDMKKSKYPVLLIRDDAISDQFKTKDKKDSFMVVELDNKQIKNIKYIKGKDSIIKWIQEN
jgi:hypothetical protein